MISTRSKSAAKPALPLAIVVMGVCGVGKSRVASVLAQRLEAGFIEADDFHSPENKALMSKGLALSDEQRAPWLDAVAAAALGSPEAATGRIVIACSALRKAHRNRLRAALKKTFFVHLTGDRDLIAQRLNARQDHFVGTALLESQLRILEPLEEGEDGSTFDIAAPVETIADQALNALAGSRLLLEEGAAKGRGNRV